MERLRLPAIPCYSSHCTSLPQDPSALKLELWEWSGSSNEATLPCTATARLLLTGNKKLEA